MEQKFFRCSVCGQIIAKVEDKNHPLICCGKEMKPLIPNSTEAAQEKHIPVITQRGNTVYIKVGSIPHPMIDVHYIMWISIQTNMGNQRKCLKPNMEPEVSFILCEGERIEKVFAYCNLHGLWEKDM